MALTPITPQMLKDAGRVAQLPLAPTDLVIIWQSGAMVVADASDVGGGSQVRQTARITTASLASQATQIGTVALGKGYRLLIIDTSAPCRVRLYTTAAARDADLNRQIGFEQPQGSSLMLEFISTPALLTADLSPTVDGFNSDGLAYYSVTNLGYSATPIVIDLTYLPTEV